MLGKRNGGTRERGNGLRVLAFLRSCVPAFPRSRVPAFFRQLAGMPDYAAYLEHLGRYHPDTPPPSERQFYEDYLKGRYGDGPTRCC